MIFCILPASAFRFTLVSSNGGKASTTGNHTGSHAFLIAPERRRLRTLKIKKQIANVTCEEYPWSIRYIMMVKHWSKCFAKTMVGDVAALLNEQKTFHWWTFLNRLQFVEWKRHGLEINFFSWVSGGDHG